MIDGNWINFVIRIQIFWLKKNRSPAITKRKRWNNTIEWYTSLVANKKFFSFNFIFWNKIETKISALNMKIQFSSKSSHDKLNFLVVEKLLLYRIKQTWKTLKKSPLTIIPIPRYGVTNNENPQFHISSIRLIKENSSNLYIVIVSRDLDKFIGKFRNQLH